MEDEDNKNEKSQSLADNEELEVMATFDETNVEPLNFTRKSFLQGESLSYL